jgi:hypothetical protein
LELKFPETKRTGNFFAGTGNFSVGTGNFFAGSGNSGFAGTICCSGSNAWYRHSEAERSKGVPESIPGGMVPDIPGSMDSGLAARPGNPALAADRNHGDRVRSIGAASQRHHDPDAS